jgi:sterol desaturase/sphingolipid hydroxylase (fatty acid hydroxylase superfamily)
MLLNPAATVWRRVVAVATFPLTFCACAAVCWYAIATGAGHAVVHAWLIFGVLAFYVLLEAALPLRPEWGMTPTTFRRDVKFLIVNGSLQALARAAVGWLAITLSVGRSGPLHGLPVYIALPILFVIFEFLQYWYHRLSHEFGGPIGRFLWRVHAAHHLPRQVYALIHIVGHPLDSLANSVVLMTLLPGLLGCTPETAFLFAVFANHQGVVSHLNARLHLGWANFLLAGPEVHRFHHSTKLDEAKNYGAVLMLFDHAFGTFVYRPGQAPDAVGVTADGHPDSTNLAAVLAFPFRRER